MFSQNRLSSAKFPCAPIFGTSQNAVLHATRKFVVSWYCDHTSQAFMFHNSLVDFVQHHLPHARRSLYFLMYIRRTRDADFPQSVVLSYAFSLIGIEANSRATSVALCPFTVDMLFLYMCCLPCKMRLLSCVVSGLPVKCVAQLISLVTFISRSL